MSDWSTIASLSTAAGTLVLAVATFGSVRSANRAARAAETSMLGNLRPLLVPTRFGDPDEKVSFQDDFWVRVPGGRGIAHVDDDAIHLAISLRNVGRGIAVLDRWTLRIGRITGDADHGNPDDFRRLTRDLYVAPSDRGFWQGALRDPSDEFFISVRKAIEAREALTVELLYRDFEGGQRMISRFTMRPDDSDGWTVANSRNWNLDRPEPR